MSQIEDLESSIDIVDLVKRYTNLKKAGANYKAICPFPWHNEKTPSFMVSPSKQIAHCFWCHRGWWPLKFIMDVENCDFKDAIEILSSLTGIEIKWYNKEKEQLRKNIYWLFRDIVQFYKNSLQNNPHIQKYLFERWLTEASISQFDFWFASSWKDLLKYLKEKWYEDSLILETNVFLDIKIAKDKFLGRVIFPIKNIRWDIVGLAGRVLDNSEPKYLNSPASQIYDKSSILYGLFEARAEITKKDFIIITEGYMDTITLHQAGFKNVVCVSGTALTEKHVQIIKKLTKRIYLCFDNDSAWAQATNLSIEMLKNKDLEVKILVLEWGKDPDEIIKSWGNFQDLIERALSPIWYHLKNIQQIESLQDKKEVLKRLLQIVKNYQDDIEKDFYLKEISRKLDIKLEIIYDEYNKTKFEKRHDEFQVQIEKHALTSEDLVIWYIIKYPEKISFIQQCIQLPEYIWYDLKNFLEKWMWYLEQLELSKKNTYLSISQNDEALEIKAQIENQGLKNDEKIDSIIQKTIDKLNRDILKQAEQILKEKIALWDMTALTEYQRLVHFKK